MTGLWPKTEWTWDTRMWKTMSTVDHKNVQPIVGNDVLPWSFKYVDIIKPHEQIQLTGNYIKLVNLVKKCSH